MANDEYDAPAGDDGVNIANGIVVVTGIVLILAIWAMCKVSADQYQVGWLAK